MRMTAFDRFGGERSSRMLFPLSAPLPQREPFFFERERPFLQPTQTPTLTQPPPLPSKTNYYYGRHQSLRPTGELLFLSAGT